MLILGHRGTMGEGYPAENTLPAFRFALEAGADGYELDVHLTKDHRLVVHHDLTLQRMTGFPGILAEQTTESLAKYKVGLEPISSLEEVLLLTEPYLHRKPLLINIELKGQGTAQAACDMVEVFCERPGWDYHHFVLSSFRFEELHAAHRINPRIPLGALWEGSKAKTLSEVVDTLGFSPFSIHPVWYLIDPQLAAAAALCGIKIITWGIEHVPEHITLDEPILALLKRLGVYAAITNWPDKRLKELSSS